MEDNRKIKVKLFTDRRHFTEIEIKENEVEKVREINRMTWREESKEIRKRMWLEKNKIGLCSLESVDENTEHIPDTKETFLDKIIEEESSCENKEILHFAIKKLKPRQQEMIKMVFFEEKPQSSIAKRYGISESAVSHAMERIYAKLRKILEEK